MHGDAGHRGQRVLYRLRAANRRSVPMGQDEEPPSTCLGTVAEIVGTSARDGRAVRPVRQITTKDHGRGSWRVVASVVGTSPGRKLERIKRRPVLGGLINEYERAA